MKDKRKRDFRKQKAAKSKPRGALGGRHRQQDITGDSFTLCGSKCPPVPPLGRSSQAHPIEQHPLQAGIAENQIGYPARETGGYQRIQKVKPSDMKG